MKKKLIFGHGFVLTLFIAVCTSVMDLKEIKGCGLKDKKSNDESLPLDSIQPDGRDKFNSNTTKGIGRQGRWFTYDGQPTYLVGFDSQELACDPTIDYVAALDQFVKYRINKVRIWTYCWFGTTSFKALTPWVREPTGLFNLDQWNPEFWERTKDFFISARDRKITVEITVFAPYPGWAAWWRDDGVPDTDLFKIAWNKKNNVNGVFSSNARGLFQSEFFNLNHPEVSHSGRRLRDYQQDLVDKVTSEFGAFENVYIEVCNEFGTYDLDVDTWHPWQLEWARRINETASNMVAVHAGWDKEGPFRPKHYWDSKFVDIMNFRLRGSPQEVSDALHYSQLKGKILSVNETPGFPENKEDFHNDLDRHTRFAWAIFMAGGHVGFYEDNSSRIGSQGWVNGAQRLKALREIAEKVSFWKLSPVNKKGVEYDRLIKKGPTGAGHQLLANPGSEYVAYFWGSQSANAVRIRLPAGAYSYKWYDVRDASLIKGGKVVRSTPGVVKIASPAITAWSPDSGLALIVKASKGKETAIRKQSHAQIASQ